MSTGIQDQVNEPVAGFGAVNIAPENDVSQVITPALPRLVAVEVALMTGNPGQGGDVVTMTVRDANEKVLASVAQSVPEGFDGFWRFDIPAGGVDVRPGERLTVTLADTGKIVFWWKYAAGDHYPRGTARFCGAAWGAHDFFFRTLGAEDPLAIVNGVAERVTKRTAPAYEPPSGADVKVLVAGLEQLRYGQDGGAAARKALSPFGFTVVSGTDPATGRPYAMALSEMATSREWGLYLADLSNPPSALCIAVPHPGFDLHCQKLAMQVWRAVPGSLLMMATVHRQTVWPGQVPTPEADPTYNTECLFYHAWTDLFAAKGNTQIQIHGFARADHDKNDDELDDGRQIVVSVGTSTNHAPAEHVISHLNACGLPKGPTNQDPAVGGWLYEARNLRATKNVQGIYAATKGRTWLHVEVSDVVRLDPAVPPMWQKAMAAVAQAWPF